jgi:glutamyl-tRNA reductase
LLTGEIVEGALKRRRQRPIFLVDTAVPGDVEPAVGRIGQIYLYDLDDLERLAMRGLAGRQQSAAAAWKIVGAEVASFERARGERQAVPAITVLRGRFEEIGREVAAEAGSADPEEVARRLVNRLLHAPSETLRQLAAEDHAAGGGEHELAEALVRRLFRLDDVAPHGAAPPRDDEENGA